VDPAAIVTSSGTNAIVPVVHNATTMPPAGAAALRVTVPVADAPVVTLAGLTVTDARAVLANGVMVSAAVLLTPL
jgi:thiamine monophosphate synthase